MEHNNEHHFRGFVRENVWPGFPHTCSNGLPGYSCPALSWKVFALISSDSHGSMEVHKSGFGRLPFRKRPPVHFYDWWKAGSLFKAY